MEPTPVNCNGAYFDCAPTVSPTEDVVEQTKEAIILSCIIAGLAVLATAFLVAGMYHSTWYPVLAKKYGWELPEEDLMEELSSTHSQTALVSREDRRRAVLDDHGDIENVSFSVELQEDRPQNSTKKKSLHVKFKDVEAPEPEPQATPSPQAMPSPPVASPAEAEILLNMQQVDQSRDLLFGPGTFSTAPPVPVEAAAPAPTAPLEALAPASEAPATATTPDPTAAAPAADVVLEAPLIPAVETPSGRTDSPNVSNPFGESAVPPMAAAETEPTITI